MKLFALAFLFFTTFGSSAFAVDYDYESARRAWDARKAELASVQHDLDVATSRLNTLQQAVSRDTDAVNTLTNRISSLRNQLASARTDISNKKSQRQQTVAERDRLQDDLRDRQDDLSDEERRRDNLRNEVDGLRRAVNELERIVRDLERAPGEGAWTCVYVDHGFEEHRGGHSSTDGDRSTADAAAKAACLVAHGSCDLNDCSQPDSQELRQARRELDRAREDLDQKQNQFETADRNVSNIRSDINEIRSDIQTKNQLIVSIDQQINAMQNDIDDATQEIADTQDRLDSARAELADSRSARDQQQSVVNTVQGDFSFASQAERSAKAYYDTVLANYENGKANADRRGRLAAEGHSSLEASERAQASATADGDAAGTTKGRAQGLLDAKEVAATRGYNHGLAQGNSDSALADAFQAGTASGKALAQSKAQAEDLPVAYNARLAELLASTPSATVELDITSELPDVPGTTGALQNSTPKTIGSVSAPAFVPRDEVAVRVPGPGSISVTVPAADRRHYAPDCNGEPLADFILACRNAYDSGYASGFEQGYRRAYQTIYTTAFGQSAQIAYSTARQTAFPDVQLEQGKAGARDLGVLRGFAANLATARTDAGNQGRQAVATLQARGYLPMLRSVTLKDAVDDGVLSPGERVKLTVVLDNLGDLNGAKEDLSIRLTSIENAEFTVTLRKLPALAADSRIVLQGVLTGSLARAASRVVRLNAQLVKADGTGSVLDEAAFEAGIRLPLELSKIALATSLRIGTPVDAVLTVVNNTRAAIGPKTATVAVKGDGLTAAAPTVELPEIAAGASADVKVKVTPTAAASSTLPVEIQLGVDGVGGSGLLTLAQNVTVSVLRTGKLDICIPSCGAVVRLPLHVTAGGILNLPTQFKFTGTQQSIFDFGKVAVSDNRITGVSETTFRVGPNPSGPGSAPYNATFAYVFPSALRGTMQWVSLDVKDQGTVIQTIKLPVQVD